MQATKTRVVFNNRFHKFAFRVAPLQGAFFILFDRFLHEIKPHFRTRESIMRCPFCSKEETKVIDSRLAADGYQIRRRRECTSCKERFTTFESAELFIPYIVKNNGNREPFDANKLRISLIKALEKRPVSADDQERAINQIIVQLRATGEREVPSKLVGTLAMNVLKELDKVAYIRFASVYLSFEDIDEFIKEIEQLKA